MSNFCRRPLGTAVALAIGLGGLGTTPAVLAQSEYSLGLEEVVVTARKRVESIQDISISVSAFTGDTMEQRSMRGLEDIARSTPGFTYEGFSTGASGNPTIRGLANTFTVSRIQNTAVFLNNVYLQRQGMLNLGLLDMERVEVVKGPQSAQYGRNAFAGAINYVTKKPTSELSGNVAVTIGDGERRDYRGSISGPIIEDKLLARVAFGKSDYDGHTKNDHPGRNINPAGQDSSGKLGGWKDEVYTLGLTFRPIDSLSFNFDYHRADIVREVQPFYTIEGAKANANMLSSNNDLNCNSTTVTGFMPALIAPPVTGNTVWCGELPGKHPTSGNVSVDPRAIGLDANSEIITLRTEWEINDSWTLSYVVGHADYDGFQNGGSGDSNQERGSTSGMQFGAWDFRENYTNFRGSPIETLRSTSHELRLEWDNGGRLTASGGFYYEDVEDTEETRLWHAPVCNADNLENCYLRAQDSQFPPNVIDLIGGLPPIPQLADIPGIMEGVYSIGPRGATRFNDKIKSIFGEVGYAFTDTLTGRLEGRYSEEEKNIRGLTDDNAFPVDIRDSTTEYFFTPRLTLEWMPTGQNLVYFSAAEGIKTGGFNNVMNSEQKTYDPERNQTFELGTKNTLWDNRVQLNAALYYVKWKDIQGQEVNLDPSMQARQVVGNIGDGRNMGLELEGVIQLSKNFSVDFGASFSDPEYKSGAIFQDAISNMGCDGSVCPADGDVGGNQVARTSKEQYILGLNYFQMLAGGWSLNGRLDTSYQSKQYADPLNLAYLPSRTLSNLNITLQAPQNWTISLWSKNVFNDGYASSAFVVPQFNRYVVALGAPRTSGITVDYSF